MDQDQAKKLVEALKAAGIKDWQLVQVRIGILRGLEEEEIQLFTDIDYPEDKMEQIRIAIEDGVPIESVKDMRTMDANEIRTERYSVKQNSTLVDMLSAISTDLAENNVRNLPAEQVVKHQKRRKYKLFRARSIKSENIWQGDVGALAEIMSDPKISNEQAAEISIAYKAGMSIPQIMSISTLAPEKIREIRFLFDDTNKTEENTLTEPTEANKSADISSMEVCEDEFMADEE